MTNANPTTVHQAVDTIETLADSLNVLMIGSGQHGKDATLVAKFITKSIKITVRITISTTHRFVVLEIPSKIATLKEAEHFGEALQNARHFATKVQYYLNSITIKES